MCIQLSFPIHQLCGCGQVTFYARMGLMGGLGLQECIDTSAGYSWEFMTHREYGIGRKCFTNSSYYHCCHPLFMCNSCPCSV